MLDRFDNTWGIVKESGESSVSFLCYFFGFIMYLTLCSLLFSAQVRPKIIDDHENFLRKVWEIPLEQRKWKDLVTLDTLHAFCGGLEPMPTARRLHASSRCHKSYYPFATLLYLSVHFLTPPVTFSKDRHKQAKGTSEESHCYTHAIEVGIGIDS